MVNKLRTKLFAVKALVILLFFFSLPFDNWSAIKTTGLTLNKVIGITYVLLSLFSIKSSFSINKYSKPVILLLLLWVWIFLISIFYYLFSSMSIDIISPFLSSIVMFLLIVNDVRSYPKLKYFIFRAFVFAMVVVSILILFGTGAQSSRESDTVSNLESVKRIWFFGLNPNLLGNYACFAILFIIFLVDNLNIKKLEKLLLLFFLPLLIVPLGFAGSSGAFMALLLGLIVYYIFKKGGILTKLKYIFIGSVGILLSLKILNGFDYLYYKLILFFETGNNSGRTKIWSSAVKVISNNAIFGLGKSGGEAALLLEHGKHFTAHNVYLDVTLWGGIVGFSVFFSFLAILFFRSLKNRKINNDISSLTIFIVVSFLLIKSGGGFTSKYVWLFFSLVAFYTTERPKTQYYGS